MPTLTIDVPAEHRNEVTHELLAFYAASAEALHHAADEYLRHQDSPRILLVRRAELAAIDGLVKRIGWHLHGPLRSARLTGEINVIAEVGRRVLSNVIEDMTDALSEAGCGSRDIEAVGTTLRRVTSVYALIQEAYHPHDERPR